MRQVLCAPMLHAVLLVGGMLSAAAAELPSRKPGLWEIKMVFEGRNIPASTVQQCVDADTDKLMMSNFGNTAAQACSKRDIQMAGATITVDSICAVGQTTITSHAVITGSFDSAYTVQVNSKREGGPALPGVAPGGETRMSLQGTWLGACAADQRPGDMIINGRKMNIRDLGKPMVPPRP
jgi:hypothetical protein